MNLIYNVDKQSTSVIDTVTNSLRKVRTVKRN